MASAVDKVPESQLVRRPDFRSMFDLSRPVRRTAPGDYFGRIVSRQCYPGCCRYASKDPATSAFLLPFQICSAFGIDGKFATSPSGLSLSENNTFKQIAGRDSQANHQPRTLLRLVFRID